ncbi:MAG: hypothetical protein KGL39_26095 [Patescibacteria group bacterium]|nr:hypothetical protein [Patescibacteria group bacterium]
MADAKSKRGRHAERRLLRLAWLLAFAARTVFATDVKLAWNPSVSTNVNAYRLYAWTNRPDAQCAISNAIQVVQLGAGTNTTLTDIVPASYTFAATAVDTNTAAESPFSNFAHWTVPTPPTYLITVQTSTNLITWTNTPIFFRLKIQ